MSDKAQPASETERRLAIKEDEQIAENHAIFTLIGPPRPGYTLQEEIRAQHEELEAERDAQASRVRELEAAVRCKCAWCKAHDAGARALSRKEAP